MSERIDEEAYIFGQKLQRYREKARITQAEIAIACGMTKNYISSIERGVHKCNAATFIVYAEKCGACLDEIAGLKNSSLIIPELQTEIEQLNEVEQQKVVEIIKIIKR